MFEHAFDSLDAPVERVCTAGMSLFSFRFVLVSFLFSSFVDQSTALQDVPMPYATALETASMIDEHKVAAAALRVCYRNK